MYVTDCEGFLSWGSLSLTMRNGTDGLTTTPTHTVYFSFWRLNSSVAPPFSPYRCCVVESGVHYRWRSLQSDRLGLYLGSFRPCFPGMGAGKAVSSLRGLDPVEGIPSVCPQIQSSRRVVSKAGSLRAMQMLISKTQWCLGLLVFYCLLSCGTVFPAHTLACKHTSTHAYSFA